jgi:hypothetical protein
LFLFNLSRHGKLEMSATENPKKSGATPIVKLNKALKLVNIFFAHLAMNRE